MSFEIGSLVVRPRAGFDLQQAYTEIGPESLLRTNSGRGIKQMAAYDKIKVTTSGSGWIPAGLQSINRAVTHVVKCIQPRTLPADFATRQVTLPAARRSDTGFTPWGFAYLDDNRVALADVTLVGNVATVAAVVGAVEYVVAYLPQITAWVLAPSDSGDMGSVTYRWEIVVEEA